MNDSVSTLLELLNKADISSYIFEAPFAHIERFDMGLRRLLLPTEPERYAPALHRIHQLKPNSLYHLNDVYNTHYAIMKLPDEKTDRWLSIGPMLIDAPTGEQILSLIKRLTLPDSIYHELADYYSRLPLVKSQEVYDAVCLSVADAVFSGRDKYTVKLIHNSAEPDAIQQMIAQSDPMREENLEEKFSRVQKRYEMENEFLKATVTGDTKAALSAHYRFFKFASSLERMPDRLRDRKDLAITLNTLLRKSAEEAGVHPYYIDSFSNANVVRVEQCANEIQLHSLTRELVAGYCELIQQYALNSYSKPVQDAVAIIQSDLTADLSLAAIADRLSLNRSYLSTVFCKEVGKNLSAYVLEKRINRARHLLTTTPLSIQEIAWEVGIPDANYFTRLFKRETGFTPKKYRDNGSK